MFDQSPKADTDKDFPNRRWIGISCANPGCLNYARTDIDYLKAGQYKGRQRYKCKRCKKTFYRLDPPKERLKINRTSENEEQVKPNQDSNVEEPKQKPPKRKKLSFLLTYKAIQGLHEVCNSLGIDDCRELLEQIGQGILEVQLAKKQLNISPETLNRINALKEHDSKKQQGDQSCQDSVDG